MSICNPSLINHSACSFNRNPKLDSMQENFEFLYKKILGIDVNVKVSSISYESMQKRIGSFMPEKIYPETIVDFVAPVFIFSEKEPEFVMEKFTANFDDERRNYLEEQIYDLVQNHYGAYSDTGKRLLSDGLIDDYTEKDFIELKRKFLQRQKWRKQVFNENKVKTNFGWVVFHKMQEQTITFMDENILENKLSDLIKHPTIDFDPENKSYFDLYD